MASRDSADRNTRLLRLSDNAQLVRRASTPPTLTPGDDLHHAIHRHTSSAT
jgi:hypothetical protein